MLLQVVVGVLEIAGEEKLEKRETGIGLMGWLLMLLRVHGVFECLKEWASELGFDVVEGSCCFTVFERSLSCCNTAVGHQHVLIST